MDTIELKKMMDNSRMTRAEIAESVGISPASLYRKLRDGDNLFTIYEAQKLAETLGMNAETAMHIFFS